MGAAVIISAYASQGRALVAPRIRPNRIILNELRGVEAFTSLREENTGHSSSITNINADTTTRAVERLELLVLQDGSKPSKDDVFHYACARVDASVQLGVEKEKE